MRTKVSPGSWKKSKAIQKKTKQNSVVWNFPKDSGAVEASRLTNISWKQGSLVLPGVFGPGEAENERQQQPETLIFHRNCCHKTRENSPTTFLSPPARFHIIQPSAPRLAHDPVDVTWQPNGTRPNENSNTWLPSSCAERLRSQLAWKQAGPKGTKRQLNVASIWSLRKYLNSFIQIEFKLDTTLWLHCCIM